MNFGHAVLVRKAALLSCRTAPLTAVWELIWMPCCCVISFNHCRAEERGLSEEKWEKEFELLAVESCVLVEAWEKHNCDDQGWLQGQGGRGSVEQGGDTRQQPVPQVLLQDQLWEQSYFICLCLQILFSPLVKTICQSNFLSFISEANQLI